MLAVHIILRSLRARGSSTSRDVANKCAELINASAIPVALGALAGGGITAR